MMEVIVYYIVTIVYDEVIVYYIVTIVYDEVIVYYIVTIVYDGSHSLLHCAYNGCYSLTTL